MTPRDRRQRTLLALFAIVIFGVFLWLWPSTGGEEAALGVVKQVLAAAEVRPDEMPGKRDQRLQKILDSHFEDPVTVRHADLPRTGAGRRGLLIWGRLLQSYKRARLVAEQSEVSLSENGRAATVQLTVELNAEKRSGESVHERRAVELRLRERSGTWRIQLVDVAAATNDVPEARP